MKSKIILSIILCLCFINSQATITASPNTNMCVGSTTTLTDDYTTVSPGGTWSSSNTSIATVSTSGVITVGGISAGTATITYTDGTNYDYISVRVMGLSVSATSPVCAGGTLDFTSTLTDYDLNYSFDYTWSGPNSFSSTVPNPEISPVTTAGSGTYVLSVYNSAMACTETATVTVTVLTVPVVAAITGTTTVCAGSTTVLSDATPDGTWSSTNTGVATIDPASGTVAGISAGTTTISYSVTNACGTVAATTTVTVNPVPTATVTATSFVCGGGTIYLTGSASGGTPAYSYSWTGPGGFTSALQDPTVSPATAASGGSYVLIVTDANGCIATASTPTVTVDVVTATASSNSPVCTGGTLNLYGGPGGMITYSWTGPSSFTSTSQNPAAISHPTTAGTYEYYLTVTDANGCVSPAVVTTVTVGEPLTMTVSETSPWTINGDQAYTNCTGTMTLVATGAFTGTYAWTPTTGITPTNSATVTITNTVTTTYVVTGHYNGCSGSASIPVYVPTTSCSPCNYFVASYTNPSATCTACSTLQPFHTIDASTVTSANVPTDGNNNVFFEVSNTMTGNITWENNVIFINNGNSITIGTSGTAANAEFNNCHLFSCSWDGITVTVNNTVASQLKLDNNTLVENSTTGGQFHGTVTVNSGSQASPGAALPTSGNILDCESAIFNNNSEELNINYWPSTSNVSSTVLPFNITGSVFTARNFSIYNSGTSTPSQYYPFSWPSAGTLSNLVTSDTYNPIYGIASYSTTTPPRYGILLSGGLTTTSGSTNTYYEFVIGNCSAGAQNLFDNVFNSSNPSAAIYGEANASIYNNIFLNPTGTVGVGISMTNSIAYPFRLRVTGDITNPTSLTYGNQFYNFPTAVNVGSFVEFKGWQSTMSTQQTFVSGGTAPYIFGYLVSGGSYINWDIEYSSIYNIPYAIQVSTGDATGSNTYNLGSMTIDNNNIQAGSVSGNYIYDGITYLDQRHYYTTNTYNVLGAADISNNILNGITNYGIYEAHQYAKPTVNYLSTVTSNTVTMVNNGITDPAGIRSLDALASNIESNTVSGPGFNTPTPSVSSSYYTGISGIMLDGGGSTSSSITISCNITHDLNFGFSFPTSSYVNWIDNVMQKESYGMYLNGSIGQQGTSTSPIDNYWEYDGSSPTWWTSTSGVYQTITGGGGSPSTSELYVRNVSPQNLPTKNTTSGGTAYSSTYLPLGSTSNPYPDCTNEATVVYRVRNQGDTTGNDQSSIIGNIADQVYSLSPNPSNGNVTIRQSIADDKPVDIRVMNYVGAVIYSSHTQFSNGQYLLDINDAVTGIYLVEITDATGASKTFKITVEK